MSDVEMGEMEEKENNADLLEEILKQGPSYTELCDSLEGVMKKYKMDTNKIETRTEQFRDWITTMMGEMDSEFVGEFMPQFYDLVEQLGESEYQLHISKETLKGLRTDYNSLEKLEDYNIKEAFDSKRAKNLEESSDFRKQLVKQRCKELKKQLRDSGIEWKRQKLVAAEEEEKDEDSGLDEEKKEESEDDMEVMNAEKSYICKITRKPFVDPYYFEECGHRYEYAAIVSLFNQREEKPLECPILGCKAKIDDISRLLKDEKTKYLTHKWLQEKKRKKDEKPVADFTLPPGSLNDANE